MSGRTSVTYYRISASSPPAFGLTLLLNTTALPMIIVALDVLPLVLIYDVGHLPCGMIFPPSGAGADWRHVSDIETHVIRWK